MSEQTGTGISLTARCPQCGEALLMPESNDPATIIRCNSCGAELGTVGDAVKALEAAKKSIADQFGEELGDGAELGMEEDEA